MSVLSVRARKRSGHQVDQVLKREERLQGDGMAHLGHLGQRNHPPGHITSHVSNNLDSEGAPHRTWEHTSARRHSMQLEAVRPSGITP